ncbi:MAG TPA: hypothetical protein VF144_15230 [Chitinophagaceae bacterium]
MTCTNCGKAIDSESNYCQYWGDNLTPTSADPNHPSSAAPFIAMFIFAGRTAYKIIIGIIGGIIIIYDLYHDSFAYR